MLDAAHDTFEAAFVDLQRGKPPRAPDKLRIWLLGIARYRCLRYMRGTRQAKGRQPRVDLLLHDETLAAQTVDDDSDESGTRRRQAQVDRLLAVVVASFDERWQRIYQLSVVQGLRGRRLAEPLGVTAAEASRLTHDLKNEVLDGFGALVLARDGRRFCAELARILDEFAWNGDNFTTPLRKRILDHLDNCRRCDNCAVCNERRKPLVIAYQPILVPPLLAPDLRERVTATIRRLCASRGARPNHARRRQRRRGVLLLLLLLLLLPATIIVLVQPSLPWTQDRLATTAPRSTASAPTSTVAPTPLADLTGTWRVAPYTLSGDRVYINNGYITAASPTGQTWTFSKGRCAQGSCSYQFLTSLSQADHPELTALHFLENARPGTRPQGIPMRLQPVADGFTGTGRTQTQCGQNVPGPGNQGGGPSGPLTETVRYKIRVLQTATTAGTLRATKLEITATLVQDPSSSARAGGCLPGTSVWRTTAVRTR